MSPRLNSVDAAELSRIYGRRFEQNLEYRNQVWKVLTTQFFQRWVPRESSVLDLGCGYGVFINNIEAREKLALDMNPDTKSHLSSDVHFIQQDCSQPWPIPCRHLDAVFTSNFFEHLPSKQALTATILEAWRCLRVGGLLMALGPNVRHLPGAYWDFWDHHLGLTELSLKEALETSGFQVEVCVGRFLPYTMVNRRRRPMILISLYLAAPIVWKFLGKQFFLVARKLPNQSRFASSQLSGGQSKNG
jgi:SAM-dependent methyltransferase